MDPLRIVRSGGSLLTDKATDQRGGAWCKGGDGGRPGVGARQPCPCSPGEDCTDPEPVALPVPYSRCCSVDAALNTSVHLPHPTARAMNQTGDAANTNVGGVPNSQDDNEKRCMRLGR